jgi:hypothetical protein
MTDKRVTGTENSHATLHLLHRFGWLSTKMVAASHWSEASQGEAMARRTLGNLYDSKLVLHRKAEGTPVWVLSISGARLLRDQYDLDAVSGQGLKLAQTVHRACSNWHLINKMKEGFVVWTEHEIQTGRAPWGMLNGKTADGLIDTDQGLVWVEVENSWKNRSRRQAISDLCGLHLGFENGLMTSLGGGHHLARLEVVSTNDDALRLMLQTFKEALYSNQVRDAHLSAVEFTLLPVSSSLVAGKGWTRHLWSDLILPSLYEH